MTLLTESNPKTIKGESLGYLTTILHLAPSDHSGYDVCASASPACRKDCLFFAGRGKMKVVSNARIRKTREFFEDRKSFLDTLMGEIDKHERRASRLELKPAARINGLSDLLLERVAPEIFSTFPNLQFYDYTKHDKRMKKFLDGKLPSNYYLTFSRSETNEAKAMEIIRMGGNVAVLFRDGIFPEKWKRFRVHNGDTHDLRFLDPGPRIIGLKPKGPMVHDETGFVVDL